VRSESQIQGGVLDVEVMADSGAARGDIERPKVEVSVLGYRWRAAPARNPGCTRFSGRGGGRMVMRPCGEVPPPRTRAIGRVGVIEGEDEWSNIHCIVCDRQPFYKTL
jgi:hypothetical protein